MSVFEYPGVREWLVDVYEREHADLLRYLVWVAEADADENETDAVPE